MGAYDKPITDHQARIHPYESIYPDNCEVRLMASLAMKPFVCIKDLFL